MKYKSIIFLFLLIISCITKQKSISYINFFNINNFPNKIEKLFSLIPRINSIVYYDFTEFNTPIKNESIPTNYKYIKSDFKTSSGSAVIIYNSNNKLLLLTCAHIIYFPDTTYLKNKSGLISGIIIKKKQDIYISGISKQIDIIAMDTILDIALLGITLNQKLNFYNLSLKKGNSDLLEWGDNIFILGYPKGLQAINQGIINLPYKKQKKYILTNTLFNKGLSGGAAFAINNKTLAFEFIGIAKSTLADFKYVLQPDKDSIITTNDRIVYPYQGKTYISKLENINYGLTQIIPINVIYNKFIKKNKSKIEDYNCDFTLLFK